MVLRQCEQRLTAIKGRTLGNCSISLRQVVGEQRLTAIKGRTQVPLRGDRHKL